MLNPTIRVALVEDRHEIREGLRQMIAGSQGFECCGAYGSMEEALPAIGSAIDTHPSTIFRFSSATAYS